jgi:uncharacterized protein (DUF952 family)
VILHLIERATWDAARSSRQYEPASLATEGFVHCTADLDTLLVVANSFYQDAPGQFVALELDEDALTSEVRWEAPAHPDGRRPVADEPLFPHVYGPLDIAAVRAVRPVRRGHDGGFTGYGPPEVIS